ncbi:WecB/TagA/CpsF family glycosyltransferase [Manganibacter manganicus]|uniref:UDP-N-acetyl-D-mannosaminuronic acid transferase n=1 Tax=Manganibacter manganicus TaxID=1873176 RepID=A0A1V8RPY2_9HYPH|nr:WecB/TagA/CpsF family glycosyltransferase [Pseudaminobacter manganicus]OQM75246.1 UDP-N-acetyl-D-mannosaminuronic acid transferase [Pseudaminobacter manganicus]
MNVHAKPIAGADTARKILGVAVANIERAEALDLLERRIKERRFTKLGFLNAHGANLATTNPDFASALQDFLILPDGVGVDIAAKLLYGVPFRANLNGTDFVPALLRFATPPITVGLLGASRCNVEAAADKLKIVAPQHRYPVMHDGFFSPADEPGILRQLAEVRPDILLVAMGMPRQELWMARHLDQRHCTVAIAVGALFDFLAGAVPRAPKWVRRLRLEWVFRMGLEPKRLWRRYVLGNPLFLARVAIQKLFGPKASGRTSGSVRE